MRPHPCPGPRAPARSPGSCRAQGATPACVLTLRYRGFQGFARPPPPRHVLEVHRAAGQRAEGAEADAAEEAFFKRYLEYARARVSPRLSEAAAASLVSQYVELREQARARPPAREHASLD